MNPDRIAERIMYWSIAAAALIGLLAASAASLVVSGGSIVVAPNGGILTTTPATTTTTVPNLISNGTFTSTSDPWTYETETPYKWEWSGTSMRFYECVLDSLWHKPLEPVA